MIRIIKDALSQREEIFSAVAEKVDVSATVKEIIEKVRREGDAALYYYAKKFDRASLTSLRVSEEEIKTAIAYVDPKFIEVLRTAAKNIREFHEKQKNPGFQIKKENGVVVGQKVIPVDRAGLYVPGGTAAYPSTVLMDAIPAKIAGCKRVVMVTPPDSNGSVNPHILAAAYVAGVDEIYKIGGAGAIAALAYGTETVPKTDKIVGPGNAYVAEAKRQVYGEVSIDMIAGPSEIMVIADGKNRACDIAADLLSQAEHDKMASAVLVTDSEEFANLVASEIEAQIPLLERSEIARASIDTYGKIIVTESLDDAVDIANGIAPEHLEICVDEPFKYLERVRHAGSVFLGRYCPEALGDYFAGTNHTLPTSGTAKFSSPLSVDDFVKKTQYIYYDKEALREVSRDVEYFAKCEGLTAHAKSAVIRFEEEK
ncbi:MAG: histidinol dehydrogenase [Clostridia bacterium]|nr:histidinol dehydrogenase [Clostridia bacterium]